MREDAILSKHLSAQICNATGAEHREQEDGRTALGGIIADAMGLGKTLTILVSILRSKESGLEFTFARPALCSLGSDVLRTKATIVVVPSARKTEVPCQDLTKAPHRLTHPKELLENWEFEIQS